MHSFWNNLGSNHFTRSVNLGIILLGAATLMVGGMVLILAHDLPDIEELKTYEPRLATRILDRNGELLTELFTQRRLMTPLDQVPQNLVNAVLATEDARFWDHWGVDVIRIVKAAAVDITSLSLKQGASTITQQLARDLYLHKKRTFGRKLKEVLTAIQIERHYSKREILEMYLTQIYFGHGAYGISAASERYFGKTPSKLTLAEAATLTGLPKAPANYSPILHPAAAMRRRNLILRLMLDQGFIERDQYEQTVDEPLELNPSSADSSFGTAPYFTEMVRQKLSDEGDELGFDYLADGLTVNTSIDARLQRFAEMAVYDHLGPLQSDYRFRFVRKHFQEVSDRLYGTGSQAEWWRIRGDSALVDSLFPRQAIVQVAVVALDPSTGDILVMIGGRDFAKYKYNRAVQAIRQPGSVFKPFVYTTAIDNGYSPAYELLNQDVVVIQPDGSRWAPQNYDGSHGGLTTLREGLRRSLNLVTVRLVQEVVPPAMVINYARQMGITTHIDAVDAMALGSCGLIPIEATAAFGCFASGGVYSKPRDMFDIRDRFGETIKTFPISRRVALSAETAYIMTDMLRDCLDRGTGASARWLYGFKQTAGGKTGTTNEFTDAWFIGFTPKIVCGVWVGLDDPAEPLGPGQSGAVAALPIWANFMKMAYDSLGWDDQDFPMPSGVVRMKLCQESKELATPYCPATFDEIFKQDSRPTTFCRKHGGGKG